MDHPGPEEHQLPGPFTIWGQHSVIVVEISMKRGNARPVEIIPLETLN